jgi:hypothetical protein
MASLMVPFHAARTDERARWLLVTQNLLASAARFERSEDPDPATIKDLSAFIDVYCLYDKLVLMKDPSSERLLQSEGSLFGLLKKNRAVVEEEVPPKVSDQFLRDAQKRLGVFLRGEGLEQTEGVLAAFMNPVSVKRQMEWWSLDPENAEHFSFGREWLKNAPSYKDLLVQLQDEYARRSAFFVIRTFFYLAFANLRKYTFTPDAARSAITEPVLMKERLFIEELLRTLNIAYEPHGMYPELRSMISPLSVIVYERAARRDTIMSEVESLREQLAQTREEIHNLEHEALNKGEKQSRTALEKWKEILSEIDKDFDGVGAMISTDQVLDLGEVAFDVKNPKNWLKSFKVSLDVIRRMCNRGPLLEIHKLIPQLGSTDRVQRAIVRLFKTNK